MNLSFWRSIFEISFVAFLLSPANAIQAGRASTPIEFWHTGDDGLSERLADAVEAKFRSSPDLRLSHANEDGTLIITIPSNVQWTKIGRRMKVTYKVAFSSPANHVLQERDGSCWEDEMTKCAAQIIKGAQTAIAKMHSLN